MCKKNFCTQVFTRARLILYAPSRFLSTTVFFCWCTRLMLHVMGGLETCGCIYKAPETHYYPVNSVCRLSCISIYFIILLLDMDDISFWRTFINRIQRSWWTLAFILNFSPAFGCTLKCLSLIVGLKYIELMSQSSIKLDKCTKERDHCIISKLSFPWNHTSLRWEI